MILLDTNILLEILENRRKHDAVTRAIANSSQPFAITVLTISDVFYIAERNKLDFGKVENLIKSHQYIDVVSADVDWALAYYKGKDFEDALQVAAALRKKCTAFMTIDSSLAKKYNKFLAVDLIV
ncbi:MAG: PIN domain-containing protein [Patescibacteria group bacterium]